MGNSIGRLFTVTSFGESHGDCVGVIIDGCPAGLPMTEADIQVEVNKRRAGTTLGATKRMEEDKVEIVSGVFSGMTTGAPICLLIWNKDIDSSYYEKTRFSPRPGHADYPAFVKYGSFNDYRGGGRFSGRTTASFVMAGAVAKKIVALKGIEIIAHTIEIGGIEAQTKELAEIRETTQNNALRCADTKASNEMARAIQKAGEEGDSLGGIIEGLAFNLPVGLGEPVFDNMDGELAKALFTIPAVKGVEFGSGFDTAKKKGSENNDPFTIEDGKIVTMTNNAGGVLGGMSTGMPLIVRVAVKPTSSISKAQRTVNLKTARVADLSVKGRHDVCIVPRAVAVVEAMMAITLCDLAMRARLIQGQ
jgi:chorismate synthase